MDDSTFASDRPAMIAGLVLTSTIVLALAIQDHTTDSIAFRRWLVLQYRRNDATATLQFCRSLMAPGLLALLYLTFVSDQPWSPLDTWIAAFAIACGTLTLGVVLFGVPGWLKPRWFRREESQNFPVLSSNAREEKPKWRRIALIAGFIGLGLVFALARSPFAVFLMAGGLLSALARRDRLDPWSEENQSSRGDGTRVAG